MDEINTKANSIYEILKFHPSREYKANELDNFRISFALKYLKSTAFSNEFITTLLRKSLREYVKKYETQETTIINKNNIPGGLKFKSGLKARENGIMEFIMGLPCQTQQWSCCKSRLSNTLSDRDIKRIFNYHEGVKISTDMPIKLSRISDKCTKLANFNSRCKSNSQVPVTIRREPNNKIDYPETFQSARVMKQINESNIRMKRKKPANNQFVCPLKVRHVSDDNCTESANENVNKATNDDLLGDERLKNIDEKMIALIENEIMDNGATVEWDDVAGLMQAKKIIKEIIVLPMLRPDIFTGLRRPPKGILLFGPPGTGKTLIGKCIASQSKSTFFSISASSLTSKWVGEGEKMVRALFAVARVRQPSVIFIDEIDSLLTQRSETEHESSRRIKTEFLIQLDGATTGEEDRILVIGATNRPQELDEAARRRFVKRLYIPLPEENARRQIIKNLMRHERNDLTQDDVNSIAKLTQHYSGADMANLCKEASMEPIRSIPFDQLENMDKDDVRCITFEDFQQALTSVRPSVSQSDLGLYIKWDQTYGSGIADGTNA